MNKKGALIHWITFGVIAAFALFFILRAEIEEPGIKGTWQTGFIWAFQDAELGLLQLDANVTNNVTKTKERLRIGNYITEDLGCGFMPNNNAADPNDPEERIVLLNTESQFCTLPIQNTFLTLFKESFDDRDAYSEIKISGSDIIGIAKENWRVRPQVSFIPVVNERMLLPSFKREYEYNPSFRINIGTNFDDFQQVQQEARALVNICKSRRDLEACLIENVPTALDSFHNCAEYIEEFDRKVSFCVVGEGDFYYNFALDFTPSFIFPVEEFTITCTENNCQLTLPYNSPAQQYTVHFTNWEGVQDNTGTPEQVFSAVLPELGFFYETASFTNPITEDCAAPVANHAYLCNNQLLYLLENSNLRATDNYFFTLTVTEDGEESLITHFEQATITP